MIDLRKNNWVKRREDAGPKTIDQIHKEAQNEEMKQKRGQGGPRWNAANAIEEDED